MPAVHLFSHTTSEGGQAFRQRFRFLLPDEEDQSVFVPSTPSDYHRPLEKPHSAHLEGGPAEDQDRRDEPLEQTGEPSSNVIFDFFSKCLKHQTSLSVLVAMGPFKGSLSSRRAGDLAETALADAGVTRIQRLHLSDGGAGFLEAFQLNHPTFTLMHTTTEPPTPFLLNAGEQIVVLEAAQCLSPDASSSRPLGEMIKYVLSFSPSAIYVGLGDTKCQDAGLGMAQALGLTVLNDAGHPVAEDPLQNLHSLDASAIDPRLANVRVVAGVDVDISFANKLQSQKDETHRSHLIKLVDECQRISAGRADPSAEGSGAGGGLAFALATLCGAGIRPGLSLVANVPSLTEAFRSADLVITGEGCFDRSSFFGKLPIALARIARPLKTKLFVFAGSVFDDGLPSQAEGVDCVIPIADAASSAEDAMKNAPVLFHKAIIRAVNVLRIGREVRV